MRGPLFSKTPIWARALGLVGLRDFGGLRVSDRWLSSSLRSWHLGVLNLETLNPEP